MDNAQTTTARIAKNTTFLTVALVLQKVLSFSYYIYYARQIGPTETGKFGFALSFVALFGILVDLGISPVLIRAIARARERSQAFFSAVLSVKLVAGLLTFCLIAVVLSFFNVSAAMAQLVYVAAFAMIIESMTLSVYGVFRGHQNLTYEAIGSVVYQGLVFTAGAVGLAVFHSTLILSFAFLIGALGNFLFGVINLWRVLRIAFRIRYLSEELRFLRQSIAPFFIAGIFNKGNAYTDNILLKQLRGDTAVGLYSPAYKIFNALQIIPTAFNGSIYPAFSALFVTSREALARTFERAVIYLALVSIPIAVGIGLLSNEMIALFLPKFMNTVPALQIAMVGLFFLFINFPISSLLNACNLEWRYTQNTGIVLVATILLNVLLIPRFGHSGAALTLVLSSLLMTLLGWYWVRKVITPSKAVLGTALAKILLCAGTMGMVIFLAKPYLPFLAVIALSILWYFALALVVRVFSFQNVRSFIRSIRHREAMDP